MAGDARNRGNSAAKAAAFRAFFEGKTSSAATGSRDPKARPAERLSPAASASAEAARSRGSCLGTIGRSPPLKNSSILLAAAQASARASSSFADSSGRRDFLACVASDGGGQSSLKKRTIPSCTLSSEPRVTDVSPCKLAKCVESTGPRQRPAVSLDAAHASLQGVPFVRVKKAEVTATTLRRVPISASLESEKNADAGEPRNENLSAEEACSALAISVSPASTFRQRGWSDLPEQLLLLVKQFASASDFLGVSRRFAASVRSHRRALYVHSKTDAEFAGKAALAAIRSSPSLRLLSLDGSKVALSLKCLAESRSGSFPKSLQVLLLRKCNKMTDRTFQRLIYRLRELRCLDIRDCSSLSDAGLLAIRSLQHLERLAIGASPGSRVCCRFSDKALQAVLGHTPAQTQASHQQGLEQQGQEQQGLEQQGQEQQGQEQQGTQAEEPSEKKVRGPASSLRLLTLTRCSEIKAFGCLANARSTLEYLDLRETGVDDSAASALGCLSKLQVLLLGGTAVGSATVTAVLDGCLGLEVLDLSRVGVVSRECLASIPEKLKRIRKAKLSGNAAVNNNVARAFLQLSAKLELLDVSKCWSVTNEFCEEPLLVAAGEGLKALGLAGCNAEMQKVQMSMIRGGASSVRFSFHACLFDFVKELSVGEVTRIYRNLDDLDLRPPPLLSLSGR